MNSPTKLTEFAPLSPEESPPVVASFLSKIFSFTKGNNYTYNLVCKTLVCFLVVYFSAKSNKNVYVICIFYHLNIKKILIVYLVFL